MPTILNRVLLDVFVGYEKLIEFLLSCCPQHKIGLGLSLPFLSPSLAGSHQAISPDWRNGASSQVACLQLTSGNTGTFTLSLPLLWEPYLPNPVVSAPHAIFPPLSPHPGAMCVCACLPPLPPWYTHSFCQPLCCCPWSCGLLDSRIMPVSQFSSLFSLSPVTLAAHLVSCPPLHAHLLKAAYIP